MLLNEIDWSKIFQCFSFQLGCLVPLLWGGVRTSDTIYNPLPLYHSSAGMLSIGPCFYAGVKVAMRNKFSANNFWKDCVKYNATVRYNFPFLERSDCGLIFGLILLY